MNKISHLKPRARSEGLVVQTLPGETLVYDLERDVAHCLNETASLVWQRCDGRKTTKQIARALSSSLNQPVDEKIVWLALDQLSQHQLLADIIKSPLRDIKRREVLRALGITAAVALPVVASILAPTPAQAGTGCLPQGASCTSGIQCCSGVCNTGAGTCT